MSAVWIIGIHTSGLCERSQSSVTGPARPPSCVSEMLSSPPATMQSASPAMMRWAAIAMVCRPDEQKRFTVTPETVTGIPARMADSRATFEPVAFSGVAQPSTTSSTSAGSIPARSTACFTTWPPSVAPCVMLNAPRKALPIGVRAVDTITASVMCRSLTLLSSRKPRSGYPGSMLPSTRDYGSRLSRFALGRDDSHHVISSRSLRGAVVGERRAFVGKLVQQRGRLVALVAGLFRDLAQPVADFLQAYGVGPVHRPAAPCGESVAVEPDHIDVARARRDALFENARAFVDHRINQPLDDLVLRNIAALHAHAYRRIDDQLLDFRIGTRRAPFIQIEPFAGLLAEAALLRERVRNLVAHAALLA